MELDKCITKTNVFSTQLRESILKDISKISESLTTKYNITYKDGAGTAAPHEISIFISQLFESYHAQNCCAITKSGTRCSNKSNPQSKYCRKHIQQAMYSIIKNPKSNKNLFEQQEILLVNESTYNEESNHQISKFDKKFIDDTLYLVDSKFIYDSQTKNKVGYIDNGQFILTDDPFELGVF